MGLRSARIAAIGINSHSRQICRTIIDALFGDDQAGTMNFAVDRKGEKMTDLIDRQAAIDALNEYFVRIGKLKRRGLNKGEKAIRLDTVGAINSLPSAQPEQKVGKWIRHEDEDGEPYGHNCSVCGEWYVMPYGKTKFCPNCGAKMEEQDEN